MKRVFLTFAFAAVLILNAFAEKLTVSAAEQKQMLEEAENWIDDMPAGLQDRLSDAVSHAMHGFNSEIEYFRNISDTTGIRSYPVAVENITGGERGDIPMRLYYTNKEAGQPLLIYFHGGGWSVGSLDTSDKFCRALASEGKIKVISVSYPLAPENPYPAALDKCMEAVKFIADKGEQYNFLSDKISLGGDGSGGNLALASYSGLQDKLKVKSIVLYYPLLKTSGELNQETKREFGRGFGFDSRVWTAFSEAYKGEELSELPDLPPTLLITAGRDIIIDEEKGFSSKYSNVSYIEFEGALHGFITDGHQPSAFKKAVELTNNFLSE